MVFFLCPGVAFTACPILTKLGHKDPTLIYSLAATILVQICRRGTVRCLFENFKKYQKSQFEFQNSSPSFAAPVGHDMT